MRTLWTPSPKRWTPSLHKTPANPGIRPLVWPAAAGFAPPKPPSAPCSRNHAVCRAFRPGTDHGRTAEEPSSAVLVDVSVDAGKVA